MKNNFCNAYLEEGDPKVTLFLLIICYFLLISHRSSGNGC